jgi:hypothetical protein
MVLDDFPRALPRLGFFAALGAGALLSLDLLHRSGCRALSRAIKTPSPATCQRLRTFFTQFGEGPQGRRWFGLFGEGMGERETSWKWGKSLKMSRFSCPGECQGGP